MYLGWIDMVQFHNPFAWMMGLQRAAQLPAVWKCGWTIYV